MRDRYTAGILGGLGLAGFAVAAAAASVLRLAEFRPPGPAPDDA
jgi:hypothetical protein